MNPLKPYPSWVCRDCAYDAMSDKRKFKDIISTMHIDICEVCEDLTGVTEPRDFFYPEFKGHDNA